MRFFHEALSSQSFGVCMYIKLLQKCSSFVFFLLISFCYTPSYLHFRIANIKVQIAKLDSESWPGLLDPERDRLILISEKEELLKELQYVKPCKRAPSDAEKIETEKKRLEQDLQAARDSQSKALTER